MLPNRKDVAMPRFLTLPSFHQDGSGQSQFVYMPSKQEASGSNSVSNQLNKISDSDHLHTDSTDKGHRDQTRMENGSNSQAPASPMEGMKRTISAYCNASFEPIDSRDITFQNDETWFSKSTDQVNKHTRDNASSQIPDSPMEGEGSKSMTGNRITTHTNETLVSKSTDQVKKHTIVRDNTFNQAPESPNEVETNAISTHCKLPFGSMASKRIITPKDDAWISKSTDRVNNHTSIDSTSSHAHKSPMERETSSMFTHYEVPYGSMASKRITTKDEAWSSKSMDRVIKHTRDNTSSQSHKSLMENETSAISTHCKMSFGSMAVKGITTSQKDEAWISKSTDRVNNHKWDDTASQAQKSPMAEEKTSARSTYCKVPFGSMAPKQITTPRDEAWFSESTNRVNNHESIGSTSSQAYKSPMEGETSSISTHCKVPYGSMASKGIITKDETWCSKSTDRVIKHTRENTSSQSHKSPMEEETIAISTHCKLPFGSMASKGITTQNDKAWISKSTERVNNHTWDNTASEAHKSPMEDETSAMTTHCKIPFGSMASKGTTTHKDEAWSPKSTDRVKTFPNIENALRQTTKSQIEGKTRAMSTFCNATFGSMASKDITTEKEKTGFSQFSQRAENEAFSRSATSMISGSTTVSSVSKIGIERSMSASQLPKNLQKLSGSVGDKTNLTSNVSPPCKYSKPDTTSGIPRIREDEIYNLEGRLPAVPSGHSTSLKDRLFRANNPVRYAANSGPFSIQRLLSSQKPSQESAQVPSAPSSLPSLQECDRNKQSSSALRASSRCTSPSYKTSRPDTTSGVPRIRENKVHNLDGRLRGVPSGHSSSLKGRVSIKGGFLKDKNPASTGGPLDIQTMLTSNEPSRQSQAANTPSSVPSPQGCVLHKQSSSVLRVPSSTRDSTAHRQNSHYLTTTPNENSLEKDGHLQTKSSTVSPGFHKHSKPLQMPVPSNGSLAKTAYASNRQNPGHTRELNSQLLLHPGVFKLSPVKTRQNRNLPVATVQAMTTSSNSLPVCSTFHSPDRSKTSRYHPGAPRNKRNSIEGTRNIQQWCHKDPKIQMRNQGFDVDAMYFPDSTSSLYNSFTTSKKSDLETFVSYLTEPESPNTVSVMTEQTLETSFDIGQESLLERPTYHDRRLSVQPVKRLWTLQPSDIWMSDEQKRMEMYNNPGIYPSVTERQLLQRYDDNMLPGQSYFSNCHSPDKQCTSNGFLSSGANCNPRDRLRHDHCPLRQSHHRKRKHRLTYEQW